MIARGGPLGMSHCGLSDLDSICFAVLAKLRAMGLKQHGIGGLTGTEPVHIVVQYILMT